MNHFGDVYWSNYFKGRIVVVKYEDDINWWFVAENAPTIVLKALTRLSKMPRERINE